MSTVALGIAPNTSNIGVTPLVHRRILGAQFANCGIIDGLNVTGRNDLRYNVGAGVAVCSRGDSDGKTIAYHEGGQTPAVSAGDPSNPRIDIVWICAQPARIQGFRQLRHPRRHPRHAKREPGRTDDTRRLHHAPQDAHAGRRDLDGQRHPDVDAGLRPTIRLQSRKTRRELGPS